MLTFVTWCGVPVWAWSRRQAAQVAGTCRNMELQQKPVASGNLQTCLRWKWWSCCTCSFVLQCIAMWGASFTAQQLLRCLQPSPTPISIHFLTSKASSSSHGHSLATAPARPLKKKSVNPRARLACLDGWITQPVGCSLNFTQSECSVYIYIYIYIIYIYIYIWIVLNCCMSLMLVFGGLLLVARCTSPACNFWRPWWQR